MTINLIPVDSTQINLPQAAQRSKMSTPVHFAMPIYPIFQLLDLTGPLDILNLLSSRAPGQPLTLTLLSESLDPVPTKPIPPKNASWKFDLGSVSGGTGGKANTTFNQYLTPDATYQDYLDAVAKPSAPSSPKPIDVLLIPGGLGSRTMRVDNDTGTKSSNVAALLDFIPKIAPHVQKSIITVCTGSDILAQAGLLDGRRATTNIMMFKTVSERRPAVDWQHYARWCYAPAIDEGESEGGKMVRKTPETWTSAGISAGMDVTLAYIANYWSLETARGLAKSLEYEWREVPEGQIDPLYEKNGSIES